MTLSRRELLLAGASGGLLLAGCGNGDPRLNTQTKALARRSVAIDYASYYAPIEDVRRLVTARARQLGAALTLSQDADGSAAQVENLKRWTGARGGFRAVAVAPFDAAAVAPVAQAAIERDVAIVAFVDPLEPASARITVDHARAGRLLARAAGRGPVLLVGPPPGTRFGAGFADAAAAIGQELEVAATVTALARADAEQAVRGAGRVRTVLAWNDLTALGAADATGGDAFVGGLGAPALSGLETLDALAGGRLDCLVAPRLAALAAALVEVPFGIAQGRPAADRAVPVSVLRRGGRQLQAFRADFAI